MGNLLLFLLPIAGHFSGATGFSQPDSTTGVETEEKKEEEEVEVDGEPSAAELRRRRLRKLDTTPPLDH